MAHAKQASKRKRRRVALPILGAAGASLAMGGGASATVPIANVPSLDNAPLPEIALYDEEISDVSLATFYVFDKENFGTSQLVDKVAHRGCGGCAARGCRGCAVRGCRACGGCAVRRGCGCGGCGCGGCSCGGWSVGIGCGGGCGVCWRWTGVGWIRIC
jgi:hypothetical protein